MVHVVFKIVAFTLLFNVALVLLGTIFPFTNAALTGYSSSYSTLAETTQEYIDTLQAPVQPGAEVQESGLLALRIFDLVNIAFLTNFLSIISQLLFGIILILQSVFTPILPAAFSSLFFTVAKGMLLFFYGWAAFELWSLRKVSG